MKDFFYGVNHKRKNNNSFFDDYEEELAIKKAKEFFKGMTMDKIRARLAEMNEQEAKLLNDDDIIIHILAPKETIMGLVRKYFPQYEHGTPPFDAKVEEIVKRNGIHNPNLVLVGQRIEIPITKAEREAIEAFEKYESENKSNETPISFDNLFHYVQNGDTLDNIIQRYFPYLPIGSPNYQEKELEFMERHDLKNKHDIKVGQQLVVVVTSDERKKADLYYKKNNVTPNPYLGNVGDMLHSDLLEKQQIEEIAKQNNLDIDVVLANRLSEKQVKQNFFFQKAKYKHLVSHGGRGSMITGETYLPSKNEAQDNLLNSLEIKNIPLDGTELAFLAICGSGDGGENLSIAESFMQAGVEQTISTHWKLNSEFSSAFSHIFYQKLAENPDHEISQILRETQLYFLKNGKNIKDWGVFMHLNNKQSSTITKLIKSIDSSNIKELQPQLKFNEAFLYIRKTKKDTTESYKALVITHRLFEDIDLGYSRDIEGGSNYIRNTIRFEKNTSSNNYKTFYNLYWGKIDAFLEKNNVFKIYLKAEGDYQFSNLNVLFDNNSNSYLIEKYQMEFLY